MRVVEIRASQYPQYQQDRPSAMSLAIPADGQLLLLVAGSYPAR